MCGIFGVFSSRLPDNRALQGALDTIRHRGPDDEGYLFVDTRAGTCLPVSGPDTCSALKDRYEGIRSVKTAHFDLFLASRRLAIIDLSSGGHQPMPYRNGDYWITYNGEIFNYKELGMELRTKGHRFDSHTDTEVVVAAYAEWGEASVRRFNGQWSFCIFDRREGRLFCSRDRFGIKPFYYWFDGEHFAFASEMKALFKLPFVKAVPNGPVLSDFVAFSMLDHAAETVFKGVSQLLPAHNLTVDLRSARIKTDRYYDLSCNDEHGEYDHKEALKHADNIRDLLTDAVKIRLVADVPVGSCLSGGLDSSSIVVITNKLLREQGVTAGQVGERQKTFSLAYDDPSVNEKHHAEEIVNHTQVEGFFTYPAAKELWRELGHFLHHQDGLCFATNVYAGWDVMRLASRHVKVVLNGQGADETLGGYVRRYDPVYAVECIRNHRFRELLGYLSCKQRIYGSRDWRLSVLRAAYIVVCPDWLKVLLYNVRNRKVFGALERLLGDDCVDRGSFLRMADQVKSLNHRLWRDTTGDYLPQLLSYDDRNAAAFSIENRVPFVDHRLIEYAFALPSAYKLHNGWSKWLLRLAMRDLLPEKILWRKDKIGLSTPERSWVRYSTSPIPGYMQTHGIEKYGHFVWRLYLAERLMGEAREMEHQSGVM